MPTPNSANQPVRIVVVDDHPVLRRGLIQVLDAENGLGVCGEAATVAEARAAISEQRPDVAIIDLSLGDESGLDLVAEVVSSHPEVRVLVLSSYDERLYADRALKAGALGYITKGHAASELIAAVRRVAGGKTYLTAETSERILSRLGPSRRGSAMSPLDRLSDRERHVLTLVGRGLTTREIAERLGLSIKTVESHTAHIKVKLDVRNIRELTRAAVKLVDEKLP